MPRCCQCWKQHAMMSRCSRCKDAWYCGTGVLRVASSASGHLLWVPFPPPYNDSVPHTFQRSFPQVLRKRVLLETEILVEQQPPQGVLVCDHAGLVINKFSLRYCSGNEFCLMAWKVHQKTCLPLNEVSPKPTLEATQGYILSQSPTDATRFWWHLYGS